MDGAGCKLIEQATKGGLQNRRLPGEAAGQKREVNAL